MKRYLLPLVALLALVLVSGAARAEELSFVAVLSGANETPPVETAATGIAHVVVDTTSNKLRFEVYVFDIDNLSASHIHRAPAGVPGPIVYPFSGGAFSSPLTGELNFNPDDLADLLGGNLYVNVHSTDFPAGEIRGQLEAGELRGRQVTLLAALSSDNETPPIAGLDAGGTAEITLDLKLLGNRVVHGFTAFDVNYRFPGSIFAVGLHVHRGAAGVPGPVLIDSRLPATADADGRGNITLRVPTTRADRLGIFEEILADPTQWYVNLHTSVNPGGAIRGQLQRRRTL